MSRPKPKTVKNLVATRTADLPEPVAQDASELPPVNLAELREKITQVVGNHALTMVGKTIDNVKAGHYLGMKYLFEVVGLYPATVSAESGEGDSLAAILLRNLGIAEGAVPEEMGSQTKVSKDSLSNFQEAGSDAVE